MRKVEPYNTQAHLPQPLDEVKRGETIIITGHSPSIARIVSEADSRAAEICTAMERIAAFRQTMPDLTVKEILSARHEGHNH
jgi:antitoxin (DNA-binding transcriptional repressor) of toxin-antitoxin stability system